MPMIKTVYFFRAGKNDPIKIGVTINVRSRLIGMQSHCWEKLEVLGVMPGTYLDEIALHKKFIKSRIMCEWFHPTKDILRFIKENTKRVKLAPMNMKKSKKKWQEKITP